jgi:hypothetical protein
LPAAPIPTRCISPLRRNDRRGVLGPIIFRNLRTDAGSASCAGERPHNHRKFPR